MGSWTNYPEYNYATFVAMQAQITGLQESVEFLVAEAASWRTEVEALTERDCADELALRDAAIEGLRKRLAIAEGRLNAFKAAHELLQDFHADNKAELEQTRAELAAANAEADVAVEKIVDLNTQLDELRRKLSKANMKNASLEGLLFASDSAESDDSDEPSLERTVDHREMRAGTNGGEK